MHTCRHDVYYILDYLSHQFAYLKTGMAWIGNNGIRQSIQRKQLNHISVYTKDRYARNNNAGVYALEVISVRNYGYIC